VHASNDIPIELRRGSIARASGALSRALTQLNVPYIGFIRFSLTDLVEDFLDMRTSTVTSIRRPSWPNQVGNWFAPHPALLIARRGITADSSGSVN
jgi:hypothetical protein